jgi:hypothetical protein
MLPFMSAHTTKQKQMLSAERDLEILRLAKLGWPSRRIAEQVGCSGDTARRIVKVWLAEINEDHREEAEHYRARQIERVSATIAKLQARIEADPDDAAAYGALAKFETILAKVTGVDLPAKVEAETNGDGTLKVTFTMG